MAGCCGSDGRSRAGKLLWPAVWLLIGAFVVGLWVWERQLHHHAEVGPHGGPLADWGDGAFHLEVVHDRDAEAVTVYVLDRWAKKPKTTDAATLTLTLRTNPATAVRLEPVPNEGDPPGRHSRYIGRHPAFKAEAKLTGTVSGTAWGKSYSGDFSQN
ncbi:MAG: hypothetical protein K8U57_10050 [Planctomycetes bacterium]|nr:hypothetical protein [Planctomycetota bacterium]